MVKKKNANRSNIFQLLMNRSTDKELDRCCLVVNNSMGIVGMRKIATDSLGYDGIDRASALSVNTARFVDSS